MTPREAHGLRKGDHVFVHSKQFLFWCRPARWVRARVEEVREKVTRPEVPDVIVRVTVTNESDSRVITVRFADRSAIHFTLHPRIEIEPELVDWTTGEGETLKEYPTICEHEQ